MSLRVTRSRRWVCMGALAAGVGLQLIGGVSSKCAFADSPIIYVSRSLDRTRRLGRDARTVVVEKADDGRLMIQNEHGARILVDANRRRPAGAEDIPEDVMDPHLSSDAQSIVFTGFSPVDGAWRIYRLNIDGTNLRKLTRSDRVFDLSRYGEAASHLESYDDLDPCFLSDGRICIVSTRYPGIAPNGRLRATNLYVMNGDGSDLHRITSERFGADTPVQNPRTGEIVYSRWWLNAGARERIPAFGATFSREIFRGVSDEDFSGVNTWSLATIRPDGTGLRMFSGSGLNRALTIAYRPTFSAAGEVFWLFIQNSPLLGREGSHGLRLGAAGDVAPTAVGGPQNSAGGDSAPRPYYPPPAEPAGRDAPFAYSGVEVLSNGDLLVTGFPTSGARDIDVFVQTRIGGRGLETRFRDPVRLFGEEGRMELDAIAVEPRTNSVPVLLDRAPRLRNKPSPRSLEEAIDQNGSFEFIVENIFFNAPVNSLIATAPPMGDPLMIEFYMNPQRSGLDAESFEPAILLGRQPVPASGRVEMTLPAGVPLFEVLRNSDGDIALGRDEQVFHVGGMNFGNSGGRGGRCLGCHAGHSLIQAPADSSWTNIAPSARVTTSSLSGPSEPQWLVDRRTLGLNTSWSVGSQDEAPWVELTWSLPVRAREIVLHSVAGRSASLEQIEVYSGTRLRMRQTVGRDIESTGSRLALSGVRNMNRLRLLLSSDEPVSRIALAEIEVIGKSSLFNNLMDNVRGDSNCDAIVNLTDAVGILNYLFLSALPPCCPSAMDADQSGSLDLSDVISVLSWLYQGAESPAGELAGRCEPLLANGLACGRSTCN